MSGDKRERSKRKVERSTLEGESGHPLKKSPDTGYSCFYAGALIYLDSSVVYIIAR